MTRLTQFAGTSLCVVGNINRDLRTTAIPATPNLLHDGETSVSGIHETIGGGGANSALAAAALGARVALWGKIGDDHSGRQLESLLRSSGVKPSLTRDPCTATGTSLALTFDTGERHFVSSLPNNEALTFNDLDLTSLRNYRHLLRADVWFSEQMLFEGNEKLFRAAVNAGVPISLDLNWDPQWGRAQPATIHARKSAVRALLPMVDLAHGNIRELREFTGATDLITALSRLEEWGARAVVVHMGPEGAGYFCKGTLTTAPAAPARKRVHTTGTGDLLSVCMMLWPQVEPPAISDQLAEANRLVAQFIEGEIVVMPTWNA